MLMLKRAVISLLVALILLALVGFVLPSEYRVARTVVIDAPAEDVYQHVVDLREWRDWGVWFKRDPQMVVEYSGPEKAIGMKSNWQSESQGNGEMTITALTHNKAVVYDLYFPDMDMRSEGKITITETNGGTKVEWSDQGDVGNNPVNRYFVLFLDSMLGPDFEAGLSNLKTVSENAAS
jgi:uncharacterized protein YndB with AHSA1/START domain